LFIFFYIFFSKIYLEARLSLKRMHYVKSIVQLCAFIAAWHTAMSRVSDFKHHYTDVMAGAAIGISVAIFIVSFLLTFFLNPIYVFFSFFIFFYIFLFKDNHYWQTIVGPRKRQTGRFRLFKRRKRGKWSRIRRTSRGF